MQPNSLYEFGPYQLDPAERVLRRDGVPVSLTPKAFEVLLALVEKSGRVVEKSELMSRVWPDAFVEDQNLAFNISVLRKTLGSETGGDVYIETVPKRGYRFTANVRQASRDVPAVITQTHTVTRVVTQEEVEIDDVEALTPAPIIDITRAGDNGSATGVIDVQHQLPPAHGRRWKWLWILPAVLILVLGAIVVGWWLNARRSPPPTSFKAVPFTTSAGFESDPAISPDGNQIAYVWQKEGESPRHIYVQLVDSSTPLQLTHGTASESDPTWSPDGRRIAFFRSPDIYVISALGGPERKVTSADNGMMSWSPDGSSLAITDKPSGSRFIRIYLVSVESGERKQLTFPEDGAFDGTPAFSPDGQMIAFNRSANSGNVNDLYVVASQNGQVRRITNDNRITLGVTWSANNELVFSSDREGPRALWRISLDGTGLKKLEVGARNPMLPTISVKAHRLAFVESVTDANVWRLPLSANLQAGPPVKLIASTLYDSSAQYSPDGKRITFRSDRSGSNEIWLCDSEGNNPIQLTNLRGPLAGSPRWSPDGKSIAFDSRHEGQSKIYVVGVDDGRVRRLVDDPPIQVVPKWSIDGNWIYFYSNSDQHIWKAPVQGGQAAHVAVERATGPHESPDGKYLYFRRSQNPIGIFRVPLAGGAEELVIGMTEAPPWGYWTLADKGIYYLIRGGGRPRIVFFDYATGQTNDVWTMEKPALTSDGGLSLSPDGNWLLFTQLDNSGSDIMLVNDFR